MLEKLIRLTKLDLQLSICDAIKSMAPTLSNFSQDGALNIAIITSPFHCDSSFQTSPETSLLALFRIAIKMHAVSNSPAAIQDALGASPRTFAIVSSQHPGYVQTVVLRALAATYTQLCNTPQLNIAAFSFAGQAVFTRTLDFLARKRALGSEFITKSLSLDFLQAQYYANDVLDALMVQGVYEENEQIQSQVRLYRKLKRAVRDQQLVFKLLVLFKTDLQAAIMGLTEAKVSTEDIANLCAIGDDGCQGLVLGGIDRFLGQLMEKIVNSDSPYAVIMQIIRVRSKLELKSLFKLLKPYNKDSLVSLDVLHQIVLQLQEIGMMRLRKQGTNLWIYANDENCNKLD
ncbi:hypothetical protein SS50377_27113 [Spironucleus salmonicida]|uniref:Uncharacterized protein n=1 Tax=Spironucleus salmonicida TaxID=348837 RepID=V6LGW9_9EUKA|nr:hypothetical protein SS50377_27113 [Spironucleus salmonicida]|eukprot:EST43762.1 Hypothetical protein SS50377_16501 [Spironucleus salmonicida]